MHVRYVYFSQLPEERPAFGILYQKLASLMSYEEKTDFIWVHCTLWKE